MKTLLTCALICTVAVIAGCTTYKITPPPTVTHVTTPVVATPPGTTVTTTTSE